MNIKFGIFILLLLSIYKTTSSQKVESKVLGISSIREKSSEVKQIVNTTITTITSFEEKDELVEEIIPYETIYEENNTLEIGEKEIKQEGKEGKWLRTYKVSYWYGEEAKRELLDTEKESPQNEIIVIGTKIVWKSVKTLGEKNVNDEEISYWKKLTNVWATSYDKSCYGCNEYTAVGAKLDYGVCAVDRTVIKLYTTIYVPGYGICQALDVGGGIQGNEIDVGFYDLQAQSAEVGWRGAHFTDIYLLDNEEANLTLLP
ncbi:MAG: G5 domain-containing protein [bacterium]